MYNIEFSNAFDALDEINKPSYAFKLYEDANINNNIDPFVNAPEDAIISAAELADTHKNSLKEFVERIQGANNGIALVQGNNSKDDYIISLVQKAATAFRAGPLATWPYQLQLLCNAYISESTILNLINTNSTIKNNIKLVLNKYFNMTIEDDTNISAEFNTAGNDTHTDILVNKKDKNTAKHDINVNVNAETITSEVKVVKQSPSSFRNPHGADLVFVFGSMPNSNGEYPIYLAVKNKNDIFNTQENKNILTIKNNTYAFVDKDGNLFKRSNFVKGTIVNTPIFTLSKDTFNFIEATTTAASFKLKKFN